MTATTRPGSATGARAAVAFRASPRQPGLARARAAVTALGAAAMGAAPHVLHHAGPLAGAALLAGTAGTLLFGGLGFLLAVPMLRRLHRRSGSWRLPGGALALMAVVFTFSSLVIGPSVTGGERDAPVQTAPDTAPPDVRPGKHGAHHP